MPSQPWWSWDYVTDNVDLFRDGSVEHVRLTLTVLALGLLVSLPLGVLAAKVHRLTAPVLALTGALYTIPALAFILAMIPVTGQALSIWNVLVPLVCYSLVVLVRNVVTGLQQVPEDVVEAATGMGYGRVRTLLLVELPLALPSVLAGVRIATVTTVTLLTIGGFIGIGELGQQLFFELNRRGRAGALAISVALVLIALVLDGLLVVAQRFLVPWTRGRTA